MAPRIVCFRTDRIGDLILTMPAMAAVARWAQGGRVSVVAAEGPRDLLEGQPWIAEVFPWDSTHAGGPLREWLRLREFDTAVYFYPRPAAAFAGWLADIPQRIGTAYRWYAPLFTDRVKIHRRENLRHEVQYNLELLAPLGPPPADAELIAPIIPEEARLEAETLRRLQKLPERYAVIHAGSGGSALNATPAWYGRLAAALEHAGLPVIMTGLVPETARAQVALNSARLPPTRFIAPPTLMVLAALLDRARVVMGPSTGPLHLAAALGVPTVTFFPPVHSMSPVRWRPRGKVGEVLMPPTDVPLGGCMDTITPDDATAVARRLARP